MYNLIVVKNITKNIIISDEIDKAKTLSDEILGMILKRNANGVVLNTRFGIHTFFMKQRIDVIILDKKREVVKVKMNLSPNSLFVWNPRYDTVIEFPSGVINKSNTEVGDKLDF
jgi:uncharacterized membrane protein (UPF0127 family)